jgi:hypothetical protein
MAPSRPARSAATCIIAPSVAPRRRLDAAGVSFATGHVCLLARVEGLVLVDVAELVAVIASIAPFPLDVRLAL